MSPLVIRTAVPFGYLAAFGLLLGAAIVGLWFLASGLRRRRWGRAVSGAALVASMVYVFWVNVEAERDLDLNPRIAGMQALSGTWVYRSAVLDLAPDGRYRCRGGAECVSLGDSGVWAMVNNYDIAFRPAATGTGARYRIVSYRSRLRFTHPIDDDPDLWDGVLLFERTQPAA